jgi:high affinity sulfate transporter 1
MQLPYYNASFISFPDPLSCRHRVMTSGVVQLSRTVRTQNELYEFYGKPSPSSKPLLQNIEEKCSTSAVASYILSLFPIIHVIKTYKFRKYIVDDVISGISAACLHFPQGLAFGILASLTPAYGLYTSFFPVLLYVFFGTSQHVSFGTNAVIAIFTAELVESQLQNSHSVSMHTVLNMSSNFNVTTIPPVVSLDDLKYKASVAAGSSFIVGILLLVMGMLRMGFITSYLSTSFISAFTMTGGIHIISSQIPNALGIKIPAINKPGKLIYKYIEIFKAFPRIHVATVIVSIICLIILILVKDVINDKCKHRMKMPIPIDVILVVMATILSYFGKLHDNYGIGVVGEIPMGLPDPALPHVSVDIIGQSCVIGIIVFVLTISMARLCEVKHNYSVDDNQELVAYGVANLGGSFFSCFPSCVAPPRTVILSTMGAKTTLNGLVSAIVILLIILFIGKYLEESPKSVLAVMIICAVKNLLCQVKELPKLWKINRYDFVIFVGTVLSGVLIDFPYALYVGVLLCLLTVVVQSQNSVAYTIAKVEQEDRLLDLKMHDVPCMNPKVAVFRMESSLYFATVDMFRRTLYESTVNPKKYRKGMDHDLINVAQITVDNNVTDERRSLSNSNVNIDIPSSPLTHIILDCSSINYIDLNGSKVLMQISSEFKQIGVTVLFGNCTHYMRNFIERSPLKDEIDQNDIYPDILDAYLAITCK